MTICISDKLCENSGETFKVVSSGRRVHPADQAIRMCVCGLPGSTQVLSDLIVPFQSLKGACKKEEN